MDFTTCMGFLIGAVLIVIVIGIFLYCLHEDKIEKEETILRVKEEQEHGNEHAAQPAETGKKAKTSRKLATCPDCDAKVSIPGLTQWSEDEKKLIRTVGSVAFKFLFWLVIVFAILAFVGIVGEASGFIAVRDFFFK